MTLQTVQPFEKAKMRYFLINDESLERPKAQAARGD